MDQPPVIITTSDDSAPSPRPSTPARPTPPTLNIPVDAHTTPPRAIHDPTHLSPSPAYGGHSPSPSYSSALTPPSPTLTHSSSVHFSDDLATPVTPTKTTLALRDNDPNAASGGETLRHARLSSVGTWASDFGTEETAYKGGAAEQGGQPSEPAKKHPRWMFWKKDKGEGEEEEKREEMAHLDPDKDTTDPTPFAEKPSRLAMLVDPKSLADLEKIGGIDGLLNGLGVDKTKGLLTGADEAQAAETGAPRSSDEVERRSGKQWSASMDERRRVYGPNDLPIRPSKSLLYLMWLAFKDKVLVSILVIHPFRAALTCRFS